MFLGANQDAILTARDLNILASAAMQFMAAPEQIRASIGAASAFASARRAGITAMFSSADRAKAMGKNEESNPDEKAESPENNSPLFSWLRRSVKPGDHANHS